MFRVAVILCLVATLSAIAQEIQVKPNYYVQKLDQVDGWQIWRGETPEGVDCFASIQSPGSRDPQHLGYPGLMSFEEPALSIFPHAHINLVRASGKYSVNRYELIKRSGERFSTEVPGRAEDLIEFSGENIVLDIHSGSHKYAGAPNTKQQSEFNLGNVALVIETIERCTKPTQVSATEQD